MSKNAAERLREYEDRINARLGWPTCDVCKAPVDQVLVREDYATGDFFIEVLCHNEREVVRLPAKEIMISLLRDPRIRIDGLAFRKTKEISE